MERAPGPRRADAVLVTHEHGDHVDVDRVRASGLPVWAPRGADLGDLAFTPVDPGQSLRIEGFEVTAVGGRHAAVVPGQEVCANLGYVVTADDESVYHPGDALAVPDVAVTTLLVPMQASWLKTEEAIGFVRAVRPDRAVGIHDGQVNDRARASINHWLATEGGADYHWLAPGTTFGDDGGGLPRVSQLRLVVEAEDFDAAVAFYRDALGLPVELDLAGDGGEHVLILDAGRATLELSNPAQVAMIDEVEVGRRVAPRMRVAFEVDDAAAATDALVAAGAELVAPPTRTPWDSLNSPPRGAGRPPDHPVRGAGRRVARCGSRPPGHEPLHRLDVVAVERLEGVRLAGDPVERVVLRGSLGECTTLIGLPPAMRYTSDDPAHPAEGVLGPAELHVDQRLADPRRSGRSRPAPGAEPPSHLSSPTG